MFVVDNDDVEFCAGDNVRSKDGYIGHLLEIRAADTENAFVRLVWFYNPKELVDPHSETSETGRKYYHGEKELIASNYQEVVFASK